MPGTNNIKPLQPLLPDAGVTCIQWAQLYGCSRGLAIHAALEEHRGLIVLIATDTSAALKLEQELGFFSASDSRHILHLPDWETLPYDIFSPHEDIVSERLQTLYLLPRLKQGILILTTRTLAQRLAPREFLKQNSLILDQGQRIDIDETRRHLEQSGYSNVSQVMSHGEFTIRGSIIDLYPMGSPLPYRIDLFDDEIESIRCFDPEKQTSLEKISQIRLLPAHEFPTDESAITRFRQQHRVIFEGDPNASLIYREVSKRSMPAGIEYYMPLFFEQTATLFDYLPDNTLFIHAGDMQASLEEFQQEINERYEQRRHDVERPLLPPQSLFIGSDEIEQAMRIAPRVQLQRYEIEHPDSRSSINYHTTALPNLTIQPRSAEPAQALKNFIAQENYRVLFVAESAGRREYLLDSLRGFGIRPVQVENWPAFIASSETFTITIAPLEDGVSLPDANITIITENQLFGERAAQRRRRSAPTRDAESIVRNLTDLHEGAPVVHEEHGVGRYMGLQVLDVGGVVAEFLMLEYAGGDKLYVPVASLHLISRYTGASPENAPLHKLGSDQWQRIKRKAAARARDVAAELLEIYARRAARQGIHFETASDEYAAFAAAFPFEETPDQQQAIDDVLDDMAAQQPMDRVVCGDVGFGKTEVAMRAAFVASQNNKQVVVLVPTTLLAQQHGQNFSDRFADWPIRIEILSRFGSTKQQQAVIQDLAEGKVDIVIGTHKLLQPAIKFRDLGLVIVDEEQRFGVRHKERLKAMRSEVDMLTLTATPIPRTLNMSLSGLRDLSIIATPPDHRLAIKTFVGQWNDATISEACQRELKRGGQVYFLHNEVQSIEKIAHQIQLLLPDASIAIAHGQMRERDLEQVMLDFYHQRFNILVCTTIIESGIDVPTANTIIMNRADKLGLSQLHQLRGRVGRSHHRAYAYLMTPPQGAMTADAIKRLEAIEALEDLGVGFTLATHDLEIRGAGELLGEGQSGQIQEIGFTLYNELLERAVTALRCGEIPDLETPITHGCEVDLGVPALLPDDYVPDVHTRLILYKRVSNAATPEALRELQVEMIDRFGMLPEYAKNLFEVTQVKLRLSGIGITRLEAGDAGGRIEFDENPNIDLDKLVRLIQSDPQTYKMDSNKRLRFDIETGTLEKRIAIVIDLLNDLSLKKAA